MAEQKLSSQGTEVNKNSTSYTSVVSPQKKKKEKKENKERVWGQTMVTCLAQILVAPITIISGRLKKNDTNFVLV